MQDYERECSSTYEGSHRLTYTFYLTEIDYYDMVYPQKNGDEIKSELKARFDPDSAELALVMEKIGEAQQMDEFSTYSHWDEPEKLADHLIGFSQEQGITAGWNRWIGMQDGCKPRLKID